MYEARTKKLWASLTPSDHKVLTKYHKHAGYKSAAAWLSDMAAQAAEKARKKYAP